MNLVISFIDVGQFLREMCDAWIKHTKRFTAVVIIFGSPVYNAH